MLGPVRSSLYRHARRQIVLVGPDELEDLRMRREIVQQVRIEAGAREHAHCPGRSVGGVARIFERGPGALEEQPLLRIHRPRFVGGVPEEPRIEQVDLVEHTLRPDVAWIRQDGLIDAGLPQLLVGQAGDAFDGVANVAPERGDVARARKAPGHPDDGDRVR